MAEHWRDAEFTEYVTAKAFWLRKVAYLLSSDWYRADDLVQATITKLYTNWYRARRVGNVDGYVRRILINEYLAEQRSSWWRRIVLPGETDVPAIEVNVAEALDLRRALDALPARQRATVVLRYYCDLSVDATAHALNCSPGTVKSQTARGLDALRRILGSLPPVPTSEGSSS
jgi:RNA polymerase sigma-70 factor (sigma-E family)